MRRTKRGGWPYSQPPNVPFEINRASPQAKGLVAWWPTLGSRGASVLRDYAGRGFHFTLLGNAQSVIDPTCGAAIDIPDNTSYATATIPSMLLSGITLVAWVRNDDPSPFAYQNYLRFGFTYLQKRPGDGSFHAQFKIDGGWHEAKDDGDVTPDGEWILWIGTYDGTVIRAYKNGIQLAQNVQAGTLDATANAWISGAGSQLPDGAVADLRIYSRALSATEVWQLYDPYTRWELYKPLVRRWVGWRSPAPPPVGGHMTLWGRYWGP